MTVIHSLFGRGEILTRENTTLTVRFERTGVGEKRFVYPDAFERHLRYEDEGAQEEIQTKLSNIRHAAEEESARREADHRQASADAKEKEKQLAAARRKTNKTKKKVS